MPRALVLLSSLAAGGAERVTVSFLRRLADAGRPVECCTVTARHDSPLADELREAGILRHDLGARRLLDAGAFVRYLQLLRRARIELVHAHGQDAWILASVARRVTRVPLVLTRHVLDEPAGNWREAVRRRCALDAARRADILAAPSTATARHLAHLVGRPSLHVHVLPNGVDLQRFGAPELTTRREALRRSQGWESADRVVLLPAVLRGGKGHDVILAALPRLRSSVPRLRLAFAGDGDLGPALRSAARPHGARVVFLGHRRDVPELLAACDLVVLPSFAEAQPTALMEAAAAGRPVVATRVGGIPEVVEDRVTGLLVPPGDPRALAEAIEALLGDPARAAAIGRAAHARAVLAFSLDRFVDATLHVWASTAGTARRVAA
jgi:glycosyltransferase involved in cell wall biosynthesis